MTTHFPLQASHKSSGVAEATQGKTLVPITYPLQRLADCSSRIIGLHALQVKADSFTRASTEKRQPEEEKPVQGRFGPEAQKAEASRNQTGRPNNLEAGVENRSSMSMNGVRVYYNSSKPAQLNALAYPQGADIHVGLEQEKHLPHEAWHVVQAQGNDKQTRQGQSKGATTVHPANAWPIQLESATYAPTNTQVDWTTNMLGGDKVGTSMVATKLHKSALGMVPNLKGSPPAASQQKTLMALLPTNPRLSNTDKYIKGHLLNHNIGGPGKDFNMFPITGSANKEHLMAVESTVKDWVNEGDYVDYSVSVVFDADLSKGAKQGSVTAQFDCVASNNKGGSITRSVPSALGVKSESVETNTFHASNSEGVFQYAYNLAVEKNDDPSDELEKVANALAMKTNKDVDDLLEVLYCIVIVEDPSEISVSAQSKLQDKLDYLRGSRNWKTELGF